VADERPFGDLPRGHFGAILADPPWKYVTYSERGQGRSASRHYEVMIFEEIATLPVRDVAAPDAWLFLWVPGPHLPFGLQLIERWGFRYSGKAFAWAKQNPSGVGWHVGTGFTTRKNTEDCLLGRRGRPPIKAHDVRELIVSPRRKHSRKPDEQYGRIERLVDGPYLSCSHVNPALIGLPGATRSTSSNPNTTPKTTSPNRWRKATAPFASALLRAVDRGFRNDPPSEPAALRRRRRAMSGASVVSLHGFQCEAVDQIECEIARGVRTVLYVAPTGSGKTVVAAEIARRAADRRQRVLFLAHRREIIDQTSRKLTANGIPLGMHGIVLAGRERDLRRRRWCRWRP
jgi:N6-adenosine-specific RNA methylase IME4